MFKNKEEFKFEFSRRIIESYGRTVEEAHITEKFMVLETMVRDYASVNWAASKAVVQNNEQKQMHYFSMEFLMGRLLVNNMMNLGIYEIAKEGLEDYGINIHDLEELESDAGLGNGGLGRLAACFMDSLASLDYPGHGNTIRYEYGLFKQKIENGYQVELPDQWMKTGFMWEVRKPKHRVPVKFFGKVIWDENEGKWKHVDAETIYAVPYDVPVIGNDTVNTNTLRLWSAEPSEDFPSNHDFQRYIEDVRSICQNLYPDDSTPAGKMLRLKQEYFFCSAGIQAIIKAHLRNYPSLDNFHEKHVIQLNDTHPVLCIPEFMRLLIDGDACPDRQKVIELALHYGVEVLLFIDFAHVIEDERIQIIMCEVGKDSVDQMILSYLQEGDLLISQDYGLASLALLKNVTILHVSGKRITEDNINNLLTSRYLGHLSRKQYKHVKGPKKRNYRTSQFFLRELEKIFIENKINEKKAILE